jgi:hypothetical protein
MDRQRIEEGPNQVIVQKWEEIEIGWGDRPDGFSLHLSMEGLKRYIQAYWDGMPDRRPAEYSAPCGTPYEAGVSDDIAAQIESAGDGLRFWQHSHEYPGTGGTDGWIPRRSGHGKAWDTPIS